MITDATLKTFRAKFAELAKSMEQELGLVLTLGTIHYGADNFHVRLEAKESMDGNREDLAEKEFYRDCRLVGLQPSDYLATFTADNGHTYQIVGLDLRKRTYPVILKKLSAGGAGCRGAVAWVQQYLRKSREED